MCVSNSPVAISELANGLLKIKNKKSLSAKELRQSWGSLKRSSTDNIALLELAHSRITHQQLMLLVVT